MSLLLIKAGLAIEVICFLICFGAIATKNTNGEAARITLLVALSGFMLMFAGVVMRTPA